MEIYVEIADMIKDRWAYKFVKKRQTTLPLLDSNNKTK